MPREIAKFDTIEDIARHIRSLLEEKRFTLLYAYNGTGKTRLSMAFKDLGKLGETRDTLYYNAYTEDLFSWENDLEGDSDRFLCLNPKSRFFAGLEELEMDNRVRPLLQRYADFDFRIDPTTNRVSFSREFRVGDRTETVEHIKVSRGEENIFIWCFFLAIVRLAMDREGAYSWVKYVYIDDPISSLDDNNAIMVANDLGQLLLEQENDLKIVISSHHSLFFNVMWDELKKSRHCSFFLCIDPVSGNYRLEDSGDTPFLNHVAMVSELKRAAETGEIYTYHFSLLRNVLERTSTFFGFTGFSRCIIGIEDEVLFSRALNLLSHGNYSVFEPRKMVPDSKELFKRILYGFLLRYEFNLPEIFAPTPEEVPAP
jgi:hypothetical protein